MCGVRNRMLFHMLDFEIRLSSQTIYATAWIIAHNSRREIDSDISWPSYYLCFRVLLIETHMRTLVDCYTLSLPSELLGTTLCMPHKDSLTHACPKFTRPQFLLTIFGLMFQTVRLTGRGQAARRGRHPCHMPVGDTNFGVQALFTHELLRSHT